MAKIDELKSAFALGLGVDAENIKWSTLEYRGIPEWDSVAHMTMVAEIEDAFDIMLDVDDVIGMSSFVIAIEIMAKYGIKFE